MSRITIDDVLAQGRLLLLDPTNGPTTPAPNGNPSASRLMDVRVPGKGPGIGTSGWMPGEAGFPFGLLTASTTPKKYTTAGRVKTDWTGYLHIGLDADIDGFTDLRGWAYAWDDALTQWFPQTYRLGALSLRGDLGDLGDLYWLYTKADIAVFDISERSFFGLVCQLQIHIEQTITWGVGLSTVPS